MPIPMDPRMPAVAARGGPVNAAPGVRPPWWDAALSNGGPGAPGGQFRNPFAAMLGGGVQPNVNAGPAPMPTVVNPAAPPPAARVAPGPPPPQSLYGIAGRFPAAPPAAAPAVLPARPPLVEGVPPSRPAGVPPARPAVNPGDRWAHPNYQETRAGMTRPRPVGGREPVRRTPLGRQ